MEVQEIANFMSFLSNIDDVVHCLNLWKNIEILSMIITIEILTNNTCPMIAKIDSIRINHGNNKEIIIFNNT